MSLTLLLICRRPIRLSLLRPFNVSRNLFIAESSTLKSKYGPLKHSTSSFENPFQEPTDEKSRRLKLQEHIRFQEKFQLEQDYKLIYAMPRQRIFSLMHLLCTFASVAMLTFVTIHFHREMLDMEPLLDSINKNVSPWILYSIATVIGSTFGLVLILISRIPVRLYYSPVRQSYALFYHPIIGVLRKKKILFRNDQYKMIPQKSDSIESSQRPIKICLEFGDGLLRMKKKFYLIETLFRSRRDIYRIKMNNIKDDERVNNMKDREQNSTQEETDIWETVVEKKDQYFDKQKSSQRRTFM
ncbi:unnamed protein product [Rotaria magnacalcarata]|uniref:Uncharacterized protein n=4 Tax=Rotaria magnacalcarata TaxID=392030 RepID=A0A815SQ13_9BILA|nr:unnamed protein product [Rotaria magnacalcarata]CAF1491735.1 unnamed protein product [Rotaria magnacalcarata]CAF2133965.1 unnamed protein product [Rotaria magnacalcarata]CAF2164005.1 unnamed protein product [Rotaria magnacalcarata]CAF3828389.1 unnamed protein product [Rotaria magnacalcarata]